jgi:membrane associated rhomboid family serine protease
MGGYSRYSGHRINWGGLLPPAIKTLLIACTAVFLVQTLVQLFGGPAAELVLVTWLGLVPRGVTHGLRVWQPFTYLFLHGGLWHLLINMFVLWMFGVDLERAWGQRRFYIYYLVSGVGAGVVNIIVKTVLDPSGRGSALVPTIGASGAIYGVLLAAALVFPDRQVWLIPFPVTLSMRVYALIMGGIEFFATLGAAGDNVSHVTHLGGMLVGYLFLRRSSFLYRFRNRYSDWKLRRARHKFEVYQRRHRDEPPSPPGGWVN